MPMMRLLATVLLITGWVISPLPVAAADAVVEKQAANSGADSAPKKSAAASAVPDAMGYLARGPAINIESLRDPFISYLDKIAERNRQLMLARQAKRGHRKLEPLENYDLSELKLVAIIRLGDDKAAMVEDNSGKGYLVRRNSHLGKNSGRVEKITSDTVLLIESVANPAGELIEREVELTLKEVNE